MNNNEEEKLLTPEEQMLRDTVLRLSCLRMQEQAGECLKKGHRDACRRGGRHCFLAFALLMMLLLPAAGSLTAARFPYVMRTPLGADREAVDLYATSLIRDL